VVTQVVVVVVVLSFFQLPHHLTCITYPLWVPEGWSTHVYCYIIILYLLSCMCVYNDVCHVCVLQAVDSGDLWALGRRVRFYWHAVGGEPPMWYYLSWCGGGLDVLCVMVYLTTLHCITLTMNGIQRHPLLHCSALLCTALPCTALHCTACITSLLMWVVLVHCASCDSVVSVWCFWLLWTELGWFYCIDRRTSEITRPGIR
jgi:hypothetical protein